LYLWPGKATEYPEAATDPTDEHEEADERKEGREEDFPHNPYDKTSPQESTNDKKIPDES